MRLSDRATLATIGAVIVGTFFLGRCSAPDPPALPPKVQARYDRDVVARAVDSAETARLAREKASERARELAAATVRKRLEDSASVEHRRADSLALVAAQVVESADSSSWAWRIAYQARTHEADDLRRSLDSAKAETKHADVQVEKADTIAAVDLRHAVRADSLVTLLVPLAQHQDQCKIAWVIRCPTRSQALVGGVVIGIAATAVATGKLKLPISIHF